MEVNPSWIHRQILQKGDAGRAVRTADGNNVSHVAVSDAD